MTNREGYRALKLIRKLFPICRSLTGDGVRDTLSILKTEIPLKIREIRSGTRVFDWVVPSEWNIRDAYILDPEGKKILDFKVHNLHVVGYSTPINLRMPLKTLQQHLHSLPGQPDAIPYVTSYYKRNWGFCLTHRQRETLKEGIYHVVIDSDLKRGKLTYADCIIPGSSKKEVFFSTYICHPSMVNNELSGPVMAVELAKYIAKKKRKYTYRFIFVPETIGSLAYLQRNLIRMKQRTIAGFVLTCLGDNRQYSFLRSRRGDTYADRIARAALKLADPNFVEWSYLDRGSDERQYGSALAELPVVTLMRSRFTTYPEYHTSLDDLSITSPTALQGSFSMLKSVVDSLEDSEIYKASAVGEPQLGKRGLYATDAKAAHTSPKTKAILDVLAYADGNTELSEISAITGIPMKKLRTVVTLLEQEKLIERVD